MRRDFLYISSDVSIQEQATKNCLPLELGTDKLISSIESILMAKKETIDALRFSEENLVVIKVDFEHEQNVQRFFALVSELENKVKGEWEQLASHWGMFDQMILTFVPIFLMPKHGSDKWFSVVEKLAKLEKDQSKVPLVDYRFITRSYVFFRETETGLIENNLLHALSNGFIDRLLTSFCTGEPTSDRQLWICRNGGEPLFAGVDWFGINLPFQDFLKYGQNLAVEKIIESITTNDNRTLTNDVLNSWDLVEGDIEQLSDELSLTELSNVLEDAKPTNACDNESGSHEHNYDNFLPQLSLAHTRSDILSYYNDNWISRLQKKCDLSINHKAQDSLQNAFSRWKKEIDDEAIHIQTRIRRWVDNWLQPDHSVIPSVKSLRYMQDEVLPQLISRQNAKREECSKSSWALFPLLDALKISLRSLAHVASEKIPTATLSNLFTVGFALACYFSFALFGAFALSKIVILDSPVFFIVLLSCAAIIGFILLMLFIAWNSFNPVHSFTKVPEVKFEKSLLAFSDFKENDQILTLLDKVFFKFLYRKRSGEVGILFKQLDDFGFKIEAFCRIKA